MGHTTYQSRYKNKVTNINIIEIQKLDVFRNHIEDIN